MRSFALCLYYSISMWEASMIFNISLHIVQGITDFPPFNKTLLQIDISSWKFHYSQHAIDTVALFCGQPTLTVCSSCCSSWSKSVLVWSCSIFLSEIIIVCKNLSISSYIGSSCVLGKNALDIVCQLLPILFQAGNLQ